MQIPQYFVYYLTVLSMYIIQKTTSFDNSLYELYSVFLHLLRRGRNLNWHEKSDTDLAL